VAGPRPQDRRGLRQRALRGDRGAFIHTLINAEDIETREPVPWAGCKARASQKNSTMQFDVGPAKPSKDPSVWAAGIGGQLTGGRSDILLFDDVEVPNNSETEGQREKLVDRVGEAAALRKPGGETIYLGTFQSMASIYRGLKAKGYAMRLWPAATRSAARWSSTRRTWRPCWRRRTSRRTPRSRAPLRVQPRGRPHGPRKVQRGGPHRARDGVGPSRLPAPVHARHEPDRPGEVPAQDPRPDRHRRRPQAGPDPHLVGLRGKQMLRELDNVGFDGDRFYGPLYVAEEWKPYTGTVLEIDPSGSGTDETAYALTSFLNGRIYPAEVGRLQGRPQRGHDGRPRGPRGRAGVP
jgi:hypothetical protein